MSETIIADGIIRWNDTPDGNSVGVRCGEVVATIYTVDIGNGKQHAIYFTGGGNPWYTDKSIETAKRIVKQEVNKRLRKSRYADIRKSKVEPTWYYYQVKDGEYWYKTKRHFSNFLDWYEERFGEVTNSEEIKIRYWGDERGELPHGYLLPDLLGGIDERKINEEIARKKNG